MTNKENIHLFSPYDWDITGLSYGPDCFHPTHTLVLLKKSNAALIQEKIKRSESRLTVFDPHGIEHEVTFHGIHRHNGEDFLILGIDLNDWQLLNAQPTWDGFGY